MENRKVKQVLSGVGGRGGDKERAKEGNMNSWMKVEK
jgi:hypothetical protein